MKPYVAHPTSARIGPGEGGRTDLGFQHRVSSELADRKSKIEANAAYDGSQAHRRREAQAIEVGTRLVHYQAIRDRTISRSAHARDAPAEQLNLLPRTAGRL